MIFCKIAGGTILLLSVLALANQKNKKAEAEILQIDGFLSFFKLMRQQIEFFALPVPEILSRCEQGIFTSCGYDTESRPKSIEEFISGCKIANEVCAGLLEKFSADFGKGHRESEILLIDRYVALLSEEKKKLSELLPSQKKLNTTLFFAAAAAIIILLI